MPEQGLHARPPVVVQGHRFDATSVPVTHPWRDDPLVGAASERTVTVAALGMVALCAIACWFLIASMVDAGDGRRVTRTLQGAVVVAGAVGAVLAPGAPSGRPVSDAVARLALLGLLLVTARPAGRWTRTVAAAVSVVAAVVGGTGDVAALALTGMAVACAGTSVARAGRVRDEQQRRTSAAWLPFVDAAVVANLLLRLPTGLPDRIPSAVAAVVAVVWVAVGALSGRRGSRPAVRRAGLAAVLVGIVVTGAGAAYAGRAALQVRDDAETGLATAREAFDAVRDADIERARSRFTAASEELDRAHATLEAPLLRMARHLPVPDRTSRRWRP